MDVDSVGKEKIESVANLATLDNSVEIRGQPLKMAQTIDSSANSTQTAPTPRELRATRSTANPETRQPSPKAATPKVKDPTPKPNAFLEQLPQITFEAPPETLPEDKADDMLMRICTALATCSNRALCPKEIAEVMYSQGSRFTGGQPFALISTCMRGHLKRHGITSSSSLATTNVSPSAPPILLSCYDLTGAVTEQDRKVMGINPACNLAVKRGTVWYLSPRTGYASPFGERDPNLTVRSKPSPTEVKARTPKVKTRRTSFVPVAPVTADTDMNDLDEDGMGRGKRKRKASAIAGGDSSWQRAPALSVSAPAPSSFITTRQTSALPTISEDRRRAGSNDSALSAPTPVAPTFPVRKIKVRLFGETKTAVPAVSPMEGPMPVFSQPIDRDEEVASDADNDKTEPDIVVMERRRFKKRSKSEGSLLAFGNNQHIRHSDFEFDTNIWSRFRSSGADSARSSVASAVDLAQRNLEEDAQISDEMDLDSLATLAARNEGENGEDYHQTMLQSNFSLSSRRSRMFSETQNIARNFPGHYPDTFSHSASPEYEEPAAHSTPSTTPRSSISTSVKVEEDMYENVARALQNTATQGLQERQLSPEITVKLESGMTLTEPIDLAKDLEGPEGAKDLQSPAGELPALPLMSAASTIGFAPAHGSGPPLQEAKIEEDAEHGHMLAQSPEVDRSLSPFSSYASPSPPKSGAISAAASPGAWSEADSFDVDCITGHSNHASPQDQFSPFPMDFDDLVSSCEDLREDEEALRVDIPEILHLDELNLYWGTSSLSTPQKYQQPPTPFGPESFNILSVSHAGADLPMISCHPVDNSMEVEEETQVEEVVPNQEEVPTSAEAEEEETLPEERQSPRIRQAGRPKTNSNKEITDGPVKATRSQAKVEPARPMSTRSSKRLGPGKGK